jgi:translation initiation factor IF-1
VVLFLFTACANNEPIEFKKIREIKLTSVKNGWIGLEAEAEFINPGSLSGKIKKAEIDISMGDKLLAQVSLKNKMKIKKQAPFFIPLKARFRLEDIQQNFLDNLLAIVGVKKLKLHFKGEIKISKFGYSQTVPIDYYQEVKLK